MFYDEWRMSVGEELCANLYMEMIWACIILITNRRLMLHHLRQSGSTLEWGYKRFFFCAYAIISKKDPFRVIVIAHFSHFPHLNQCNWAQNIAVAISKLLWLNLGYYLVPVMINNSNHTSLFLQGDCRNGSRQQDHCKNHCCCHLDRATIP